ncbi:MAG TPA: AAA family ATPase [Trinickia sp.]|uniref:AAA family ATPase n=1 Tax=Trinickia sp. TaxID=2571163 RepID=UPI002C774B7F|nr:AAA family ATPase [Trinickia sp.]HTI16875.1 AAA family ATPase [Trinickia sp.]
MTEFSRYVFSALREGDFTLYRGSGNGVSPILLLVAQNASPEALKRLQHEYALKAELDGTWAVRPIALSRYNDHLTLVLEDPGGEPLDRLLERRLDVSEFLLIAIALTRALSRVHERGLVHKDVKPANILVGMASGSAWLTGFGIASRLPREHRFPEPPEAIAGTLAYMAPEQTGRMNRSIDSRSDLYALGVTFYEMLTGTLPFKASDPMEWVHCHIARQADPPDERARDIPMVLSAIVTRLLAKIAEDRYQTAAGVEADLQRCLTEWKAQGRIDAFPLGTFDLSERLLIPERLYGREREINTLLAAFDRVVSHGITELVLVSGYSGIGKSSVVNELHKVLVPRGGLFASGKFDQYKRDIPYATLAQAFQSLVHLILGKSDGELGQWRDSLQEALGSNGALIVDLVPDLELIIGKQQAVPALSPQEMQKRFQTVFRRFVAVFARREHPLVLFLDDLQWLDAATLDALEQLVTDPQMRYLLLVGAYRDNEVRPFDPLMRTIDEIRKSGAIVWNVVLEPLALHDVDRLIADSLHCERERAQPLARMVQEKTAGNPFFVIQFLSALAEDELVAFDRSKGAWNWDLARIQAKGFTDNVVDLMVGKLSRLSDKTQDALKLLACLGNTAEIASLAVIQGKPEGAIDLQMWDAVRAGLVFRLDGSYAFLHDRVQEAAYSLICVDQRAAVHLRIGRCLAEAMNDEKLSEHIFEVVSQFNHGAVLVTDPNEIEWAADLNLRAGRKAKASTAYVSACRYFSAGMALLGPSGWVKRYDLAFSLTLELAECTFLSSQFDEAEGLIAGLLQRADSKVDKAAVYRLKIELHVVKSENSQAVDSALECLRLFGIEMPAHPSRHEVHAEYEKIWRHLGDRSIESLVDLPRSTSPETHAAMRVLATLISPAFWTDANLFDLHVCKMVNLSVTRGTTDASTTGYAWLGWVLCYAFNRYDDGYRFGKLASDLVEKWGFVVDAARVRYAIGLIVSWMKPLDTSIDLFRTAFRTAVETGDHAFANFSACQVIIRRILTGVALDEVWRESAQFMDFAQQSGFRDGADLIVSQQRFVAALRGKTSSLSTFSDAEFDESAFEAALTADRMTTMVCWYRILKIGALFLSGEYGRALEAVEKAKQLLWATPGEIQVLDYHFYSALTLLSLAETIAPEQHGEWHARIIEHRRQLREWAVNCPDTFESAATLVDAEVARIEGEHLDAERLYEDAIRLAHQQGFIQNEGVANELAARFYAARGLETIAQTYLRNARHCYLVWGAEGKVRQLELLHPQLREKPIPASSSTATFGGPVEQLEVEAVVKASQVLSSEIVLDQLIESLMRIAIEHAGAARGVLILFPGDEPRIEAEATTRRGNVEVSLRRAAVTPSELPESVLHYAIRTRESVILDDAAAQNPFSADEYFRQRHARSVLCLPLVKQAKLIGVLYLENDLASRVFTPARISVLNLLSSQAAISIENARLYSELTNEIRVRQKAEDALRASEERWRALFEHDPVGVALIGLHGRYVAANPAFQRMTGYSEAELRNCSPADITHEDDRAATDAIVAALAMSESNIRTIEKRYRRKDGGVTWAELSVIAIPVGGSTPLFAGVAVDITERKRAEDDLRRSEASLTEAQQISHTGSWRWKVGTGEVAWSDEHFRIFDFDPATTQPSYATFMERIHTDDQPSLEQALDRAVRNRSRFQHEYRIVLPGGAVKHVQSVGLPDITEAGEVEFVGTVMDITERRHAEEALRSAQAELARVARLTTMGELVASIAHEINQPLGAIVACAEAGLRWLNRQTPDLDEARRAMESILVCGKRAGNVIHGIRALAMKSGAHRAQLDINGAIQEVLALTRSDLQRHGVVLHTELSAEVRLVFGDRVQLQQVLLNLVTNGIEAMHAVTDRPKVLTLASKPVESGGVLVEIDDTGTGLDPVIADRVFDSFFTTKPSGMGMGLSICRSIIDAHGGRLWMSPRVPYGTAVRFTVPTAPPVRVDDDMEERQR